MKRASTLASGTAGAILLACSGAVAGPAVTPLVSTGWLEENAAADGLVILDIRSSFAFERAHVPGAVRTDYPGRWSTTRDDVPWVLPEIADLEAHIAALGIGNDSSVVIVPAGSGIAELGGATWIYWVLSYLGLDEVGILDGGWQQWLAEDRAMEEGAASPAVAAAFVAAPRPELIADTQYVVERLNTGTILIDARPPAHYTGDTMQAGVVVRQGHIPGALNLDNNDFYDPTTVSFLPLDALLARLPPALSDRSAAIITYCNIGQAASISWFVLHELLGFENTRVYEASLAAWTRRPDLPLVTGPEP